MFQLLPIFLSQAITILIGLVCVKLATHWVPKQVWGEYALFASLTVLGSLITHSGLANHASRYWSRELQHSGTYARFLWSQSWVVGAWLSLVIGCVCLVQSLFQGPVWLAFFPLLFVSNIAVALGGAAYNIYNSQEHYWRALILNAAANLRMILPVGLAFFGGASVMVLASGFALHSILFIVLIIFAFGFAWPSASPSGPVQAQWKRELKEYGRPFILIGIAGWVLQQADRWIVDLFFGRDQLGLLAMAWNVAGAIPNLLAGALLQLVFPKIFRKADRARSRADWDRLSAYCDLATLIFIILTLTGLLALTWIGPWLIPWLISEEYRPTIGLFLSAGSILAVSQVNQFQYLLLQAQHNSAAVVRVLLILAAVKTTGSIVAAFISWQAFLIWLVVSLFVNAVLGRFLVRRNLRSLNSPQELQPTESQASSL